MTVPLAATRRMARCGGAEGSAPGRSPRNVARWSGGGGAGSALTSLPLATTCIRVPSKRTVTRWPTRATSSSIFWPPSPMHPSRETVRRDLNDRAGRQHLDGDGAARGLRSCYACAAAQ